MSCLSERANVCTLIWRHLFVVLFAASASNGETSKNIVSIAIACSRVVASGKCSPSGFHFGKWRMESLIQVPWNDCIFHDVFAHFSVSFITSMRICLLYWQKNRSGQVIRIETVLEKLIENSTNIKIGYFSLEIARDKKKIASVVLCAFLCNGHQFQSGKCPLSRRMENLHTFPSISSIDAHDGIRAMIYIGHEF